MNRTEMRLQLLCAALTGLIVADTERKLNLDELSSQAGDIAFWAFTDFERDIKDSE